jgi:signal transduction histidine kinase
MSSTLLAARVPNSKRSLIGRRIATAFGLIAFVAIMMCALLFTVIARVSGLVMEMRAGESAIDQSHALATAIREQYTHQAHTLIESNDSHLAHDRQWVKRVALAATRLRSILPTSEGVRLDRVLAMSQELDRMFLDRMLPASESGDRATVARLHHDADQLSQDVADEADAIVKGVERRMVSAHVSATHSTSLGFVMSGLCVIVILGLSFGFTVRLRQAVLKPLAVIADAARRLGGGDFSVRLGATGEGELRDVADAFDRMVDEIRRREMRLLEAERMAAIGQLAAGVAHEINNPIGIIRGYLKTMGPESSPDALREELRILDEEAAACQRIAEDLLAYSKTPELRIRPTRIDELICESVRRMSDVRGGAAHPTTVRAEPHLLAVDAGRVRQVVLNLLKNAAQVSPTGAPIEIVGERLAAGGYEIVVSDRGPGIACADRARIFEPFFSKRSGGSGLGLAVCQGIVVAHGGSIDVEDRSAGGATFRVRLPLQTIGHCEPV